MEDSKVCHNKLLPNNSTNLSKSITLPDKFEAPALSTERNKSAHFATSATGDAVLVKIEDESIHRHDDKGNDVCQKKPIKIETILNCESDHPNVQVHHENHFELVALRDANSSRCAGCLGNLPADRFGGPSDDESSDTYPGESTSVVSKIRDILQRNMSSGLWDPLKMEHHSLFTQLNVLCHFQDGSVAWKETARWLKYEEKVEMGGRWSKPHVSTASLHALLDLRRAVKNRQCIVDLNVSCKSSSLIDFADDICSSIARATDLGESELSSIRHILQQPHKHKHRRGSRKSRRDRSVDPSPSRDHVKERRKSLMKRDGKDYWSAYTTFQRGVKPCDLQPYKPNKRLMEKIPKNTETATILIGQVGFLKQPIMGIFRLRTPNVVEGLSEISLPSRFLVLIIGPFRGISIAEHCELGRALAALFNDKVFCEVCYQAASREDILCGIDEYLDNLTVLPPSIWDPAIRLEPPTNTRTKNNIWSRLNVIERHADVLDKTLSGADDDNDESLFSTGRLFGGLRGDVVRKSRYCLSDFKDGLHIQCLASIVFLYFACITPIVTFGGLMGKKTDNYMGTMEMLMSGSICGTVYSLFAGQPLNIVGATGPLLVFESILYHLCKENSIDFLSFRCCIGLWSFFYLLIIVAFNLSSFVRYITRFTEESFSVLISLIFIIEAFSKIIEIWDSQPVLVRPNGDFAAPSNLTRVDRGCHCEPPDDLLGILGLLPEADDYYSAFGYDSGGSRDDSYLSHVIAKVVKLPEDCKTYKSKIIINSKCMDLESCLSSNWSVTGSNCDDNSIRGVPDVFLLSCLLFFGTFSCAFTLRTLRNSPFFPTMIRNLLGDFAVLVSITLMTGLDHFFGIDTPKLEVPNQFKPTLTDREWVVNPLKVDQWWLILVATFPGLLATILIALDQQITSVIINRKENKLKKGHGYHLDLLVLAVLVAICSFLGLPWFVAATVRAITHVKSLVKESSVRIPGERPQMLGVREQRVTGMCIHLLIGFSCLLTSVLKLIPMPVLYGVFLYMGITSLGDVQFIERVLILFMPAKYQPDYIYLRHVKTFNVHIFTVIQIACSALMWTIKSIKYTSIGFPLVLIALIGARKGMDLLFSQRDLFWLDNLLPDERRRKEEDIRKLLEHPSIIYENSQEQSPMISDEEYNENGEATLQEIQKKNCNS